LYLCSTSRSIDDFKGRNSFLSPSRSSKLVSVALGDDFLADEGGDEGKRERYF
jgi:hypothetical protein